MVGCTRLVSQVQTIDERTDGVQLMQVTLFQLTSQTLYCGPPVALSREVYDTISVRDTLKATYYNELGLSLTIHICILGSLAHVRVILLHMRFNH